MRASQRVSIITEVAEQLRPKGWDYADFVLEQFGIAPDPDIEGDTDAHVRRSLAQVDTGVLLALAEHFEILVDADPDPAQERLLWRPGDVRVFISHLAKDKEPATTLSRALDEYAITSFVAHEDIHPSLEWQNEIERALRTMDAMVAMVTPDFPSSVWTDQEVGFALGRGLLVIPIKFGLDPYGFFGKHQALQGRGRSAEDLAEGVYASLSVNPLTQARMVGPAITVFEKSFTFRQAEANAERLLRFPTLSHDQLQRIEASCLNNRQIYQANRCPDLLRIPPHSGHSFRLIPATRSDALRPVIPTDSGRLIQADRRWVR